MNKRVQCLRFSGWFCFINCIIFCLMGIKYLITALPLQLYFVFPHVGFVPQKIGLINLSGKIIVYIYFFLSYIGQFSLLALLTCLPLFIISFIIPNKKLLVIIGALLASVAVILIYVDAYTFALYRFHINHTILSMIIGGGIGREVLELSSLETFLLSLLFIGILLVELLAACLAYYWVKRRPQYRYSKWLAGCLAACLILSYLIFIAGSAARITQFGKQSVILPLYNKIMEIVLPFTKDDTFLQRTTNAGFAEINQGVKPFHYPLAPLQCQKPKKPYNIIILGIDAWRFDSMTKAITPNIYKFAQQSVIFKDHDSGGNATQPGLFSLFYSLPPNYWTAATHARKGPVLFKLLNKYHYRIGIFASANLYIPPFYKNLFLDIKPLQKVTPGDSPAERDKTITKELRQFLTPAKQPLFAFLFYDSAHGYCLNLPQHFPKPFQPAIKECNRITLNNKSNPIPYLNRYLNALHFDDSLVGKDLQVIKQRGLLKNTIVIITTDHGQEFNDNHRNYWEHASNFTRYQVEVPFIVYWPGRKPQVITYPTNHYDLVPTLLQDEFSCKNPTRDYSIGHNLFKPHKRPFLIVGSYTHIGIVEPNRITNLSTTGQFNIQSLTAKPLPHAKPDVTILKHVFALMRRYYSEK